MASNLPGNINLGQFNVCLFRAARLDADCSPLGGVDSGIVTTGLVSMTASPDIKEGKTYEPENGNGEIAFTYEEPDRIKRYNLSGSFVFHDPEAMFLLFGGRTILGSAASDFPNKVIGYAVPNYTDEPIYGCYIEVITRAVGEGSGDCVTSSGGFPTYIGHIFGKVRLALGDREFTNDVAQANFTGKATANPALYDGPWNDYPGVGYIPASPYVQVGYSTAEFEAIAALAGPGFKTLPTGS